MAKIRLNDVSDKLNLSMPETAQLVNDKLTSDQYSGTGLRLWVDEEAMSILEAAVEMPELVPNYYRVKVVREAPNPNYVYAKFWEFDRVLPVVVPRKYSKLLKGKMIKVEEIQDEKGCSYRYVRK